MFQLNYFNYLVLLFLIAGILVLVFDTKSYKQEDSTREEKVSRVIGWANIVIGLLTYAGNWVVQQFLF